MVRTEPTENGEKLRSSDTGIKPRYRTVRFSVLIFKYYGHDGGILMVMMVQAGRLWGILALAFLITKQI